MPPENNPMDDVQITKEPKEAGWCLCTYTLPDGTTRERPHFWTGIHWYDDNGMCMVLPTLLRFKPMQVGTKEEWQAGEIERLTAERDVDADQIIAMAGPHWVSEETKRIIREANARAEAAEAKVAELIDLLETAWATIANAGGGNWEAEHLHWQEAAANFRSRYFSALSLITKEQPCQTK